MDAGGAALAAKLANDSDGPKFEQPESANALNKINVTFAALARIISVQTLMPVCIKGCKRDTVRSERSNQGAVENPGSVGFLFGFLLSSRITGSSNGSTDETKARFR